METILVCDDDKAILDSIEIYLKLEGYNVLKAENGLQALEIIEQNEIHCLVLDIMMPKMDGLQATLKIREKHNFPIIMLSAKSEDTDKIAGLGFGADDYVTKPFNPLEVVARVKTQLRRYVRYNNLAGRKIEEIEEYDIRGLLINKHTHKCFLYGKELQLTPIEFSILWYLCKNQGKVVPSEELFEAVWGEKYLNSNNTVMAHIGRLREKMNDSAKKAKFIVNIWGVGYTIEK